MKIPALLLLVASLLTDGALGAPDDSRFHTKDAVVVSRPARDGTPAQVQVAANVRIILVELKTDKTTYREGEEIEITVHAAESGHLRLLYQNAAGEIYTLFPNQFIKDDRIAGGRPVKVMPVANPSNPKEEVAIQIAGPNFGTEHLAAIVANQPFTDEAALKEKLRTAILAKSSETTLETAITKGAGVVSRPARDSGAVATAAGLARVTLATVRK